MNGNEAASCVVFSQGGDVSPKEAEYCIAQRVRARGKLHAIRL